MLRAAFGAVLVAAALTAPGAAQPLSAAKLPLLSIADAAQSEGTAGKTPMVFTVTRSEPSATKVKVAWHTVAGTAQSSDFVAAAGTLVFKPGQTTRTLSVRIKGDTLVEPNEEFFVVLDHPVLASLGRSQADGTIENDDLPGPPTLAIASLAGAEGNAGFSDFEFTVTMSPASPDKVRVNYATTDGSAIAGSDYQATSGRLVFGVGQTRRTITVRVAGDTAVEPDETFGVILLSASHAELGRSTGTGTIEDDDDAAPVASDDTCTTSEDTGCVGNVLANDGDDEGDSLSAALVGGPSHGSLSLSSDGSFIFTPDANYNGSDSFTYKASDGQADSNVATVSLTVTAVNDAPAATDDACETDEDTNCTGNVLANDSDVDGDSPTAGLVAGPSHGSLSLNADGSFVYTPGTGFSGADSFTYKAQDGGAYSNVATVTLAVNDVPAAVDDTCETDEDTDCTGNVLANDKDVLGDPLVAALVDGASHGSLSLDADGSFVYTPDSGFSGDDTFTYKANDGRVDSNVATVTVTVSPTNDAPDALDDSCSTDEDTGCIGNVLVNDSDPDGDSLSAAVVDGPSHGSLTLSSDGSFTFTPDANYNGSDSFTYKANDGQADSNVATVSLSVISVNDAPVASDDSYSTDEDTPLTISEPGVLANDSDVEGDSLASGTIAGPSHGSLSLVADGSFVYTPDSGFSGADSFTYQANDGQLNSNVATVRVTVNAVNSAPVAADDSYSTDADSPLVVGGAGVLDNDNDPDGDSLSAILVDGPSHGSLSLNADGSFSYTPDVDYDGQDSFTYRANDGQVDSNVTTVQIEVHGVGPPGGGGGDGEEGGDTGGGGGDPGDEGTGGAGTGG